MFGSALPVLFWLHFVSFYHLLPVKFPAWVITCSTLMSCTCVWFSSPSPELSSSVSLRSHITVMTVIAPVLFPRVVFVNFCLIFGTLCLGRLSISVLNIRLNHTLNFYSRYLFCLHKFSHFPSSEACCWLWLICSYEYDLGTDNNAALKAASIPPPQWDQTNQNASSQQGFRLVDQRLSPKWRKKSVIIFPDVPSEGRNPTRGMQSQPR